MTGEPGLRAVIALFGPLLLAVCAAPAPTEVRWVKSGADEVSVWDPDHDGVVFFVSRDDFERTWSGHALLINWGFGTPPRPQTPPRRSRHPRGLPLGVAAVALVASLGMVLFLLTAPNADQATGPGAPEQAASAGVHNIYGPNDSAPPGAENPNASLAVQPHF